MFNICMAMGYTRYCGLVRRPHVEG